MYINMKKILRYSVLMVIGMSLLFYGIIEWVVQDGVAVELTDAEIVERARELGMVGIEEEILRKLEELE